MAGSGPHRELASSYDTADTPDTGTDHGLLLRIKRHYKLAKDHSKDWRIDAKEDYDFVSGEQWSAEDKEHLHEQLRPVITFNRVAPIVDAVAGSEVNNRTEVRFIPREEGDVKVNEVLTSAAEWARDQCDADEEESDAFIDAVICGMGWSLTRMDYEEDLDGKIVIERVDPFEMYWDPDCQKPNLIDAKWLMRVKKISREDLKAEWPEKAQEVIMAGPWDDAGGDTTIETDTNEPDEYAAGDNNLSPEQRKTDRNITLVEYHWWEREPIYRVAAGERVVEFSKAKFGRIKDKLDEGGLRYLKQTRRHYRRAFVAGDVLLEKGDGPVKTSFQYKAITAKRDRNNRLWFGLVRAMKDPQRWSNKFLSQIQHIINTNPKGGVMYEAGAVTDPRAFETQWAASDSAIEVADGALAQGRIGPKPQGNYPAGVERLMEFAMSAMYEVTGVNLEMMGMADRQQAGVLEYQRRQAGLTILATLFDRLRRYRKDQGRVLLYMIRNYISDGRLVRVVGDDGARYVPLVRGEGIEQYDIIVDESPTSPNQKEKTFQILTSMLPTVAKMGIPMPPELLDYSPLPSTLIEKWKKAIKEAPGGDPQALAKQMQQLQQELEKVKEQNQQLKADKSVEVQKAQAEQQIEVQELRHETMMDREKMIRDAAAQAAEIALKRWVAQQEIEIKKQQVAAQAAAAKTKARQSNAQNRRT